MNTDISKKHAWLQCVKEKISAKHRTVDVSHIRDILAKAHALHGLDTNDICALLAVNDPLLLNEIFTTARSVKEEIYGSRLVFFAPLYISNYCANECVYCAFRHQNSALVRRRLTLEEIASETKAIVQHGHKRILLVAGEAVAENCELDYICNAIRCIYQTKVGFGEIRRVNVNIAPLTTEGFGVLRQEKIGTYQLFQETYHRDTYARLHLSGPKSNFLWRLDAMDRAMMAGIDDVGIGVLFGLYDWRFEVLALIEHAAYLENNFGVGPHTISVPRLEPAEGSIYASNSPHAVSDTDFLKAVAILRLAVPYTGIIMSTRESVAIRRRTFELGVSQISAGSRTNPGGYEIGESGLPAGEQFQLGDHRPLEEVVNDVVRLGFTPSFCTACYRLGRTGADFMELAKPGDIKRHCNPNALSSFQEYLCDYASSSTRKAGEILIRAELAKDAGVGNIADKLVESVIHGKRDVYV